MFDPTFFEEINASISEVIAGSHAGDIEKNMTEMLTTMVARLDLVRREEFDVQRQALQRDRERLDALETRLVHMDMSGAPSDPGA